MARTTPAEHGLVCLTAQANEKLEKPQYSSVHHHFHKGLDANG